MVKKNLVPEYAKQYVLDNIDQMAKSRMIDRVQNISCPNCQRTMPSRFLMRQHMKQCYNTQEKQKENEPIVADFKPYFY